MQDNARRSGGHFSFPKPPRRFNLKKCIHAGQQMKAIVFDIGNVLVRWNPGPAFAPYLATGDSVAAFLDRVEFDQRNLRADAGVPFADLAAELDDPADRELLAAYPARFGATVTELIEGSWALIDRLREKGFAIHAITNWSDETWPQGLAAHPRLGSTFGTVVVSGEIGMVKPDPAIFQYFCKRARLAAEECLFIDDKPENVAAAQSIGMAGEVFTSPENLEAALIQRAIL